MDGSSLLIVTGERCSRNAIAQKQIFSLKQLLDFFRLSSGGAITPYFVLLPPERSSTGARPAKMYQRLGQTVDQAIKHLL